MYDLSRMNCPSHPVPTILPRLSCPATLVPFFLSRLSCRSCPVLAVMFWPSYFLFPPRLTCLSCPVSAVLSCLAYQGCPVSVVLSKLACPVIFWPYCRLFPALAVLPWLFCTNCLLQLSCPAVFCLLPVPALLSPSSPVSVLSRLSCPGCSDMAVL